ncbi:Putative rRNA methylase [Halobacillus dabanensis]|uniref:Putative rRNA methylase n=1 Tax=Halobacillus dabanensis TaxID=240302 RepID=A0A1I3QYH9_HALDA|nr:class I SAM-dependent methyltransferase [Halobacillus dabanensis]SFJ38945.1 Putative rRNA methylase [Halobacillus dabanensis]
MILDRILDFAHSLMERAVQKGDIVVDGTCGNGYDTAFLAKIVGETGHVYAFDVQEEAINNTKERLRKEGVSEQSTVIYDSHVHVQEYLQTEHKGNVQAAIYNLGYLPGSDKTIITKPEGTIESVKSVLATLKKGGLIVLVVYHGHPGGRKEKDALLEYVTSLDSKNHQVLNYEFINKKNTPPFILAIEKI